MIDGLLAHLRRAFPAVADLQRFATFWGPVTPGSPLLAPLAAVTGWVTLAVLTGLAVGSLSVLLLALVALYALLTEVFGLTIEFAPA